MVQVGKVIRGLRASVEAILLIALALVFMGIFLAAHYIMLINRLLRETMNTKNF
jgi:hypothetical protein